MLGALEIYVKGDVLWHREIVSGRQVKYVRRFELYRLKIDRGDAELRLGDIALDDHKALERRARRLGDRLDLVHRQFDKMRLHEQKELCFGFSEFFQKTAGDKAGETCHEDRRAVEHSSIFILASARPFGVTSPQINAKKSFTWPA